MGRRFWRALAAAAWACAAPIPAATVAQAQSFEGLKILAPAAPGGGYDRTARALQTALAEAGLAKQVTVNNVAGAGGGVGIAQFASAQKGDGKALMVGGFGMVASFLTNKASVTLKDVTPIARLTGEFSLVVVPAASKFKTLSDLLAAMKANPGAVSIAGGSAGGNDHIVAGMLAQAIGVDGAKVNYVAFSGGGDSVATLIGNQVAAGVGGYSELIQQVKAGRLRALGITSEARAAVPPEAGKQAHVDIPTLKEQGVDVVLVNWRGVMAPPGISTEQRAAVLGLIEKTAQSPGWKGQLASNQWVDLFLAGDAFAAYVAEENTRVAKVLTSLGLIK
jgi:putative tricarboxylic transport membrane protein